MFRAQQNMFDDVIAKATDENLTSENWEFMMDAWEKINESGENGPRDAAAALIKRLAHRNANVQLYTLELANAFSQNCGPRMHRELASRSFTDALLRLAADRSTHAAVKSKILERMAEWAEMFAKEPDLGIMEQAYHKLKSQNPNLAPPSKPHKREITDIDRRKEEEELQMALAISLKERQNAAAAAAPSSSKTSGQAESSSRQTQNPTPAPAAAPPHTTAATVSRVRALFDFIPTESGELAFKKGDVIAVLESVYKDWWKGSLRGQVGIFPLNYVEKLADPTADELQKEAQMEAEVFAEIKNVEKLLALLSTSGPETSGHDSEEITRLYHSTLAIRPKLIELIGKYSQKKDDFVSLNEKFIKARRDYESLLESSMAAPPPGPYGRPLSQQPPYAYDTYGPPGGQPQRFYTPAPPGPISSPHPAHAAYQSSPAPIDPPYPVTAQNTGAQRRHSNNVYPGGPDSQNDPTPAQYYNMNQGGPSQPPPQQQQQIAPNEYPGYPPQGHTQQRPSHPPDFRPHSSGPPPPEGHSHTQPQELATSAYDSPLTDRPPHVAGFGGPGPSMPPGADGRVSPQYGASSYYSYQNPAHGALPRPLTVGTSISPNSQQQHQLQPSAQDITPVSPQHGYPSLTPGVAPAGSYPAYTNDPNGPPGSGGAPQDYYRNNELFLPAGSRA
ncbi:hypothetical protein DFH27DRAFT_319815 [Peziza echinospora]|nr:hypothetical protein DFH27DRAFT_319815 [Peziza echinospora]